jgi:hypothetical protein
MHVAPDMCHDSIVWHLRDVVRATPKHRAHLPRVAASPLVDPLWEFFASNETGCSARFEALSLCLLLPLAHRPNAFIDVMEVHLAIVDPDLCNMHVLLVVDIIQKWFCFLIQKYQKNEIFKNLFHTCVCRRNLVVMACLDLL